MAPFNPSPQPVQEEDFRSYSRPTTQMEGNKALGTALTGGGKVLSDAGEITKDIGKVQEFNTRQTIENDPIGLKAANASRDASIADYANFYNQNVPAPLQTSINAPNAGVELINPNDKKEDLPVDLRTARDIISSQGQAKLDTKINQVLLTAEVDRTAKDLRSKYPDHADYIDHLYAQAGFGKPANERLQALQQFYLAANAGKDDEKKASMAEGRKYLGEIPGIDKYIDNVRNNKPGAIPAMDSFINSYKIPSAVLHQTTQDLNDRNQLNEDQADKALTTYGIGIMNADLQGKYKLSGFTTPSQINQEILDYQSGKKPIDPIRIQQLNQDIVMSRNATRDLLIKNAIAPQMGDPDASGKRQPVLDKYGNPVTLVSALGGTAKLNAKVDSILSTVYDNQLEAINNKNFGLATEISRTIQGYTDKEVAAMMVDKSAGPAMIKLKAMTSINSQWGEKLFTLGFPELSDALTAYVKNFKVNQVDNGHPVKDGLDAAVKRSPSEGAAIANDLLKGVRNIWKSPAEGGLQNDDSKRQYAKSFFSDYNKGIVTYFPEDQNIQRGNRTQFIPGRMSIFKELTDDRVANEMKRLGPDIWNMYKNWAETEHSSFLYRDQIKQLEKMGDNTNLIVGWGDEGHFHVKPNPAGDTSANRGFFSGTTSKTLDYMNAKSVIDKVNEGLDSLNHIAKTDGVSPTVYTLRALKNMYFDFDGFEGIPKDMLDSVQNSVKPSTKIESKVNIP